MTLPIPLVPHKDIFKVIRNSTSSDQQIYLVGGAVRDVFLKKTTHDLDFTLTTNAIEICREVANKINGAFYILDEKRKTARIVLENKDGSRQHLDFATLRGNSINEDLLGRDYTINAMALSIYNFNELIDPLKGLSDLNERKLRACSKDSINEDPVRILRAARLSVAFNLFIEPETKKLITGSINNLTEVSQERIRDEIFRILNGPKPGTAFNILDRMGVLDTILPEIQSMTERNTESPNIGKILTSKFSALTQLKNILQVLSIIYDPETAMNWVYGYISIRLGRYRQKIHTHFLSHSNTERTRQSLLLFTSLFCKSGETRKNWSEGYRNSTKEYVHSNTGIIACFRAKELRLSNTEINAISTILNYFNEPYILSKTKKPPTDLEIYHFFKSSNSLGIDICLISLAHTIAQFGYSMPKDIWINLVNTIQILFESWWFNRDEKISPKPLINGDNLLSVLKLNPGPIIGEILEAVKEAQVIGEVSTSDEALDFARSWLLEN
ncbi:MAG: hypothetical protein ACK2TU_08620 [Anaerolineales bacterium]